MFRALETGRLKAIWIAATNPAVSLPDLHQVRRALAKAELVVVQDAYHPTETTRLADVLLPGGAVVREGGHQHQQRAAASRCSEPVVNPPGAALPDWEILARFGQAMGYRGFDFKDAAAGLGRVHPPDRGPALRHGRHDRRAAPAASGTCAGPARTSTTRGPSGSTSTGKFPTPDGRARFLPAAAPRPARDARPRVPAGPDHGPALRPLAHADPDRASRPSWSSASRRRSSRSTPTTRPSTAWPRASSPSCRSRRGHAPPAGAAQPGPVARAGVRPVPLGRPARRPDRRQLPDDLGHRPGRQAARVQVLRRPAVGGRRADSPSSVGPRPRPGRDRPRRAPRRRRARSRAASPQVRPSRLPSRGIIVASHPKSSRPRGRGAGQHPDALDAHLHAPVQRLADAGRPERADQQGAGPERVAEGMAAGRGDPGRGPAAAELRHLGRPLRRPGRDGRLAPVLRLPHLSLQPRDRPIRR